MMSTIYEMKSTIDEKSTLDEKKSTLDEKKSTLDEKKSTLDEKKSTLDEKKSTIDEKSSTLDGVFLMQEDHYIKSFDLSLKLYDSIARTDCRRNFHCRKCGEHYDLHRLPVKVACGHSICDSCMEDYLDENVLYGCATCIQIPKQDFDVVYPQINKVLLNLVHDIRTDDFLLYSIFNEVHCRKTNKSIKLGGQHDGKYLGYLEKNIKSIWDDILLMPGDKNKSTGLLDFTKKISESIAQNNTRASCKSKGHMKEDIYNMLKLIPKLGTTIAIKKFMRDENDGYEFHFSFKKLQAQLEKKPDILFLSPDVESKRWSIIKKEKQGYHMYSFRIDEMKSENPEFFYEYSQLASSRDNYVSHVFLDLVSIEPSESKPLPSRVYISPLNINESCFGHHFVELALGRYGSCYRNAIMRFCEDRFYASTYVYDKIRQLHKSLLFSSEHRDVKSPYSDSKGVVYTTGEVMKKGCFNICVIENDISVEGYDAIGIVTSGLDFVREMKSARIDDCGIVLKHFDRKPKKKASTESFSDKV